MLDTPRALRCLPRPCPGADLPVGDGEVAKKVREVILFLETHGWRQARERGSHRQFKHRDIPAVITVSGKPSATMPIGQLAGIRRKSGIEDSR